MNVVALNYQDLAKSIEDNSLTFAPGRVLSQPERDVIIRKPDDMNYVDREQFVQVHPHDARSAGLNEGDLIQVTSDDGHVLARGKAVFESPQIGLVGSTTLFGELATKMHELEAPDWSPQMPRLGYSTVTLESAPIAQKAAAVSD